jgi:hypothetical protein
MAGQSGRPSVEGDDDGVAHADLAVADQPVLGGHPTEFGAVECLGDVVEVGSGVVGDDPRRDTGVALGGGADLLGHHDSVLLSIGCRRRT